MPTMGRMGFKSDLGWGRSISSRGRVSIANAPSSHVVYFAYVTKSFFSLRRSFASLYLYLKILSIHPSLSDCLHVLFCIYLDSSS